MAGTRKRVAVIGGGFAGLTAGVALADAGHEVIVLEARRRLPSASSSGWAAETVGRARTRVRAMTVSGPASSSSTAPRTSLTWT